MNIVSSTLGVWLVALLLVGVTESRLLLDETFSSVNKSEWRISGPTIGDMPGHGWQSILECPPGRASPTKEHCMWFGVSYCVNPNYPQNGGCYRSEFASYVNMPYNQEYWWGFSNYLPHNYTTDQYSKDAIHFQVHGNPNFDINEYHRNPMMALKVNGDQWEITTRGDPRRNITYPNRWYKWNMTQELGPIRPGEWENWVFHTKWVFNATGFVQLWRNGKKVVDVHNIGTAYNDAKGPYFKMGVYKPTWKHPQPYTSKYSGVVYGEMKWGDHTSSYEEVSTAYPPITQQK